jgi:hypothetical protein
MRATRTAEVLALAALGLGLFGGGLRAQSAVDAPQPAASSPVAPSTGADYSAAQQYNLANAYARSGRTALAVLAYERARVLAPTDPDLRWNLHRVRESAGLPESTGNWLEEYGRFADPNTMYWLGIVGLALGGCCLLAVGRFPRFRGWLVAGAVVGCAAVGASLFNAAATFPVLSELVALQPAPASVSPVAGADPLFTIPAATTVRLLDRHGDFELIRDSQGHEGWVASGDLAAVIPEDSRGSN